MTYEHLIGLDFGYVLQCISKDRLLKIGTEGGNAFFWIGRRDVLDMKWGDGRRIDYMIKDLWTKLVNRGYRELLKRKEPKYHNYIHEQLHNYMVNDLKVPDVSRAAYEAYAKEYTEKTVRLAKQLSRTIERMHTRKLIEDRIIVDMFDAYDSKELGEPVITILLEGYEPGKWWTVSEYEQSGKKTPTENGAD